jgi:S-disulfanyl-L-cysteine oxidoreductase SoxD
MKIAYAAAALALAITLSGCKVRKAASFETAVATAIKRHVTVGGKNWKNPTVDNLDTLKSGGAHFQHRCQTCHGYDGHNTGVPFESQVYPPIPDLGSAEVQGFTDGQLKWIIENGVSPSGMPAWHGIVDDNTMWKMVRYIRHLPPKGSLGAPDVYLEAAEAPQTAGKDSKSKPTFRYKEENPQSKDLPGAYNSK